MKILILLLSAVVSMNIVPTSSENKCTTHNEKDGWTQLFDGKSFDGWHMYNGGKKINSQWTINDGIMSFLPSEESAGTPANLVTDKEFTSFQLSLEWNIGEGGNSGVFWAVQEEPHLSEPYLSGPEIQLLDNSKHPDAQNRPRYHQAGALYDMAQPKADAVSDAGVWNLLELTINYKTNQGIVKLNNEQVLSFKLSGEDWDKMVNNSKFKEWPHFAKSNTGRIGLQDHGDPISFKNIFIKEL